MLSSRIKRSMSLFLTLIMLLGIALAAPVSTEAASWVYTSKTVTRTSGGTTCKGYLPQINLSSSDAVTMNNNIKSICNSAFNNLGGYVRSVNYSYAVNKGILSLVLKVYYDANYTEYYVYNLSTSTYKKLSNSQVASAFNTTYAKAKQSVANSIKSEFNKHSGWRNINGAVSAYNKSLSDSNLNRTVLYAGSNCLCAKYRLVWYAGAGHYWRLANIAGTTSYSTPSPSVNATNSGAEIKWNKVGAPKYRVYKKVSGSWKKLGDTASTKYTDKSAKAGKTYTYTVRGINSNGSAFVTGYKSSGVSVKFVSTPKVNRRDYTTDGAKVSWSKASGAAKYRLYYVNNGSWKKIGDYTGTSAELIGFESGYNYKFTVRAINSGGTQFMSGYNSTGYTFKFVDIPKINTGYVTMQRGYYIKWNKPYGAVKFRIFRKTGSGSWKKLADTTADNYHDLNVSYNTRYTYTVRCITSDGKQYVSYYDTKGHSFIYY